MPLLSEEQELDLDQLRTQAESQEPIADSVTNFSRKRQKRRQHFIQVPMAWFEKLEGATGQTYRVALCLLYANWKSKGYPFKLSNLSLDPDGVTKSSKWRALADIERRGLITVERRPSRSPMVQVLMVGGEE